MAGTSIHVKWFFVFKPFSKLFWQIHNRSLWRPVAYINNTLCAAAHIWICYYFTAVWQHCRLWSTSLYHS